MPRKQNGFGNMRSFAVKTVNKKEKKPTNSYGSYPSDRRYGSSVSRSIIEHEDLNSDWAAWRKGYEYYFRAAWANLRAYDELTQEYEKAVIDSKLYQGTDYEVDIQFEGHKYATQHSDTNNHYVIKRTIKSDVDIATINTVIKGEEQKKYKEIWCKGTLGPQAGMLSSMIGDRVTDGETTATVNYVLNSNAHPALYMGKTAPFEQNSNAPVVTIPPRTDITPGELAGKVVFVRDFYKEKSVDDIDITQVDDGLGQDNKDYFALNTTVSNSSVDIIVLDRDDELPLSLYDISELTPLFETEGSYELSGRYYFSKDLYQRFYGNTWLTGELALQEVKYVSYYLQPFEIQAVKPGPDAWELVAVPFNHTMKLLAPTEDGEGYVVFTDHSFTKTTGRELYTDVNPWMDEVFVSGEPLRPAVTYSCSCAAHSHSVLRAPQITEDEGTRRNNRQRRYPLPTVMGKDLFDGVNIGQAAGLIETWENRYHRMSYKQCKHSICSLFIDGIKTIEPGDYPSMESREKFNQKLKKEIDKMGSRFDESYRRGGISTLEIIFAMAQGLNLDDIELSYILLENEF